MQGAQDSGEEENLPDSLYGYGRSNSSFNERLDIKKVKNTLDKMGWSGWLVVERSRDKDDVHNVRKNYGTNVRYLKEVFQK